MAELIELVRPKPEAQVAVFYSFGEGLEGGPYYDSHSLVNLMHPQTLLAYEMNGEPLGEQHGPPVAVAGRKPARLQDGQVDPGDRVRREPQSFGEGEGGYNEDHEYFGELANI